MFYKNARIFTSDFQFHMGAFEVKDGLFGEILPENVPADAIDLQGATVIPGLVEVHSHGNSGADFSDGNYEGLKAMAKYYALALPQMAAQVLLTQGVYALLNIADSATGLRTLIYAIVMSVLYVVSFMIQQRWVFAPQKDQEEDI